MKPDSDEPNRLTLKVHEIAALLGLSEGHFHKLKTEGRLTNFPEKLPGMACYSRPAVLRWIATNGRTSLPADLVRDDYGGEVDLTIVEYEPGRAA